MPLFKKISEGSSSVLHTEKNNLICDPKEPSFLRSKNTGRLFMMCLLWMLYTFLFWLMIKITAQYIPFHTNVAFLSIKQDYVIHQHYLIAFYIHVYSALIVLLAGYTQFSKSIRAKHVQWHRWMGWIYAIVTLLLAGPSGLVIGIYANGGWSSQLAFCLLAVLWIFFTAMAMIRIFQKRILSHQDWMIRSFSLALSALTLRAWKYLIVWFFEPRPMDVYRIVAWLGWVLNLIIAEAIIFSKRKT